MAQDKIASIFKRGGQKAEYGASSAACQGGGLDGADAEQQLEHHLQQLAVAWAAPKLKKGLAAAVWRPAVGAFEVIERGRQAFNGQGFTHNRKLYLNIEEAVYLLDRATTLLLIESEVQQQEPQQQQQAQQQAQQQQVQPVVQQRLLSVQEALHMMAVLGVQHERLCVLSYLSRLGFTVRRHPACWQVPAHVPACSTWQVNPAWAHTDGLTPLSAAQAPAPEAATQTATAAPAAAAATAAAAALSQHQHVSNSFQQQQQQASSPTAEQAAKRRKVQDAAPEQQQQQQQQGTPAAEAQPELPSSRQWYGGLPAWLHPQQQQQGDVQEQQDGEVEVVAPLLGLQLKQQFPLLRPLQRYRDTAASAVSLLQQQQQPDAPGIQRECCAATTPKGGGRVSDVVFDVIVKHDASKFSYRQPPAPQFSIAMMHPGCNNLPRLDEVLDLSRAVAAAAAVPAAVELLAAAPVSLDAAAAAGGAAAQAAAVVSGSSSSRVSYRPVKFGLPEEGDVGFCELVPLRLMDLLTNM